MVGLLCFVFTILASPFKSKILLEAENTALRHQLIVLRRQVRGRVRLTNNDHLLGSSGSRVGVLGNFRGLEACM
jgi:hypothetical protein